MNNLSIRSELVAIVLGGTDDHILLIKKLQRKRYCVLLIDYNEDPPARKFADRFIKENILEKDIVLNIARNEKASLVVAACIDQALPVMAYVSEKLSLPCHLSYAKALQVTNKKEMKKVFSKHNIPTSKFVVSAIGNLVTTDHLGFPLVVKPLDANSSKGITRVNDLTRINDAIKYARENGRLGEVIIEEYAEGNEYSADVVIKDHEANVLMITESVKAEKNSNSFTIVQSFFDRQVHRKYAPIIKEIAEDIAIAFDLNNINLLIQLIINDGVSVIEFSPRIGGGSKHYFIKKVTGFDVLECYLTAIISKSLPDINSDLLFEFGAISYLYADKGVFVELKGADELKHEGTIADFFHYKTSGMQIENHTTSSDRPAAYMVLDNDFRSFREKQEIAKRRIKIMNSEGTDVKIDISCCTSLPRRYDRGNLNKDSGANTLTNPDGN